MNKTFWDDFFRWMENASIEELRVAKNKAAEELETASDPEIRSDLKRMIRYLEEEILTRLFFQRKEQ